MYKWILVELVEGPPKQKGKIRNGEALVPGVPKWWMEYAVFNLYR
jgi:hypothetical protein